MLRFCTGSCGACESSVKRVETAAHSEVAYDHRCHDTLARKIRPLAPSLVVNFFERAKQGAIGWHLRPLSPVVGMQHTKGLLVTAQRLQVRVEQVAAGAL